jgi:hypothetical protein
MAYFNHAFTKRFLGTGATRTAGSTGAPITVLNPASTDGFITTAGTTTTTLSTLTPGYFGFFDKNTYESVDPSTALTSCCPLILASSSLLQKDKLNQFIGGYRETNKSKVINPKYVHAAYVVEECTPKQAVLSIGNTPQTGDGVMRVNTFVAGTALSWPVTGSIYTVVVATTGGTGTGATLLVTVNAVGTATAASIYNAGIGYTIGDTLTADGGDNTTTVDVAAIAETATNNFLGGTTEANCCFEFLCGETYYLRIDVKGSPALRFLNHNAYQTVDAYTGCCSGPTPTLVDSTLVMIEWAKRIVLNNYIKDLILPVVFDETGVAWYAPGTTVDPISNAAVTPAQWWDAYVSPGHVVGACAGMRLFGAYVETKFGNCSFQITDFFEKEPVRLYASLVDYNGDPCVFEGICVYNDCLALQGMGFGEQVVRDLILSESYLQNFFATDIRVREITQGSDILNSVDRNLLYTRYYILHNVPRFNNPTSTFDNDRYMLEIITNGRINVLETFIEDNWLGVCADCINFEVFGCTPCEPANN